MPKLTTTDVERLLTDPSEETRVETAVKIADDFHDRRFTPQEAKLAIQIFEIMVNDASRRVRQALSDHLSESPDLPHEVVSTLARDIDEVAFSMLRYSDVLTDEDLKGIVESSGEAKQLAVAGRAMVSEQLSQCLVTHGTEKVVTQVMGNPGARVADATYETALERFAASEAVSTAITRRGLIPVGIAERLIVHATESLQQQLSNQTEMGSDAMADLVMRVRERATLSLVDPRFGVGDARELVRTLDQHGRLTPSIILRGLCMGDLAFFEAAMAHFAKLPDLNAMVLVHDEGRRGLQALWAKARMPMALFPAVKAAVEVADELNYDGERGDRERYRRRVIERLLTQCDNGRLNLEEVDQGSVEYLLAKLDECRVA